MPFPANLTIDTFTLEEFETWVDQIAQTARDNNVKQLTIADPDISTRTSSATRSPR
jgi:hypothetical protein